MTNEDIEERFMKINNKSGIVAVYFYDERSNTHLDWVGIGDDYLREDSDESSLEDEDGNKVTDEYKTIRFEYLDKEGVKDLLHNRVKVNHAILQAFVEPDSEYNNCIYVDWSRTHCTIERRFNKVKLNDERYSIQQRGATFEKLEGVTDKVDITSKSILQSINEEIFQMCDYIKENSPKHYEISNLKCMMKIDKKGRLNLLWTPYVQATKMDYRRSGKKSKRSKLKGLVSKNQSKDKFSQMSSKTLKRHSSMTSYKSSKMCFLALPDNVDDFVPISKVKPIPVFKNTKCPLCEKLDVKEKMITIRFSSVIKDSLNKIK